MSFLALCVLDVVLKCCIFGAFSPSQGGDDAYFSSGWHRLEFGLVIGMILAAFVSWVPDGLTRLYAFRFMMLVRPLLSLAQFSGIRQAVETVKNSFQVILALLTFTALLLVAFTITSLYAFGGKLHRCVSAEKIMRRSQLGCTSILTSAEDGIVRPLVWGPPEWENFDDGKMALLTMVRALTSNGFVSIVGHVSFAEPGIMDRAQMDNKEHALLFILFQVFGGLMVQQCMTSILINAIDVSRRRSFLTADQKALKATKRLVVEAHGKFVKDSSPQGIKLLQAVVNHSNFEFVSTSLILLNVLILLSDYREAHVDHVVFKERANVCFVVWYTFEQCLKLAAFSTSYILPLRNGKRRLSAMNGFDLIVTLLSLFELSGLIESGGIHVLRSIRTVRLLQAIPSVSTLMQAIIKSIKVVVGCFTILLVITFSYSVVGSSLFSQVKYGQHLNRQSNFETPTMSLLVMCRMVGGEDWLNIMDELAVSPPYCTGGTAELKGDCGSIWAIPFFLSFYILIRYLFLPLFLASLICTFFEAVGQDTLVQADDLRLFGRVWHAFDPYRTGFICSWKIRCLLNHLSAEKSLIGKSGDSTLSINSVIDLLKRSRTMSILAKRQTVADGVSFLDVAMVLITAHRYPCCIANTERSAVDAKGWTELGASGGIIETWARRRNATSIRDALLLPSDQHVAVSDNHAPAGKLWQSHEGLLHVWVLGARALPIASAKGVFCSMTLLHHEEENNIKPVAPDENILEDESPDIASPRHHGPILGWFNQAHTLVRQSATPPQSPRAGMCTPTGSPQTAQRRILQQPDSVRACAASLKSNFRRTTHRTQTKRGSANPRWNEHFVIPLETSHCSLVFSVSADSTGSGHKPLFGWANVDMNSIVRNPCCILDLPLLSAEGLKTDFERDEPEIVVRLLYKRMGDAQIDLAAHAYKCVDGRVNVCAESPPSCAAPPPISPQSMQYYIETAFRRQRLEQEAATGRVSDGTASPQGTLAPISPSSSSHAGCEAATHLSDQNHLDVDIRIDTGVTCTSEIVRQHPESHFASKTLDKSLCGASHSTGSRSLEHESDFPGRNGTTRSKPEAAGLSAQFWSYLQSKAGQTENGIVISSSAPVPMLSMSSRLSMPRVTNTSTSIGGGHDDDHDRLSGDIVLSPVPEPDSDQDESLPAPSVLIMEAEKTRTRNSISDKVSSAFRGLRSDVAERRRQPTPVHTMAAYELPHSKEEEPVALGAAPGGGTRKEIPAAAGVGIVGEKEKGRSNAARRHARQHIPSAEALAAAIAAKHGRLQTAGRKKRLHVAGRSWSESDGEDRK